MKILMVCLGNICRSPLAHGIMESLIEEHNLPWEVDSAGTGTWHIGKAPDHRSIAIAQKNGINISGQICRQICAEDFTIYDRIYVMDHSNLQDVRALAKNAEDKAKVQLLLKDNIVPDPYWDDSQFAPVFDMVLQGCRKIIHHELKREKSV